MGESLELAVARSFDAIVQSGRDIGRSVDQRTGEAMQNDRGPLPVPVPTGRGPSKSDLVFPLTSWSLLARAAASARVTPAVHEFADLYYGAVRDFIGAIVRDPGEAQELTQKFFLVVVLQGTLLHRAERRPEGRFRDYLKQAVRNFLIDEHRHRTRKKRRAAEPDLRPDGLRGGWEAVLQQAVPAHDKAFLRGWAQSLVRTALERVRTTCKQKGQDEHFEMFVGRYLAMGDMPSWRELGAPFKVDEKTARSRTETVARHFRSTVRDLIATDRGSPQRSDEEISELISLF
jgi:DNA-directed RNA polymerase specialized sigma24 family protein